MFADSKDGSGKPPADGGRNPTVDFKGEERKNDTHASTTDPQARLFTKAKGDKAHLCYLGHTLMENRHGLIVDVETTLAIEHHRGRNPPTGRRKAATTPAPGQKPG